MLHTLDDSYVNSIIKSQRTMLVNCCLECNGMLGARYDESLLARKRRVRRSIKTKYRRYLELPDWSEEDLDTLGRSLRQNVVFAQQTKQWILARLRHRRGGDVRIKSLKNAREKVVKENSSKELLGNSTAALTVRLRRSEHVRSPWKSEPEISNLTNEELLDLIPEDLLNTVKLLLKERRIN